MEPIPFPSPITRHLKLSGRFNLRKLDSYVWTLLADKRSQIAVESAEQIADGTLPKSELLSAEMNAEAAYEDTRPACELARGGKKGGPAIARSCAALAAASVCRERGQEAAGQTIYGVTMAVASQTIPLDNGMEEWEVEWRTIEGHFADMARDHFNPFRSFAFVPSLLTWNGSIIVELARVAYEERSLPHGTLDNMRLAVLADALEEAGAGPELIAHLRQPNWQHYRGCWAVDAILGKQ